MQLERRTARGHFHAEAFCLMRYMCGRGHQEILWNSRDGVTPFIIRCVACGAEATHVQWQHDVYAPDHVLGRGQRFFRDGTPEEAEAALRRRVAMYHDPAFQPTDERIRAMATDPLGEFSPGWPAIDIHPLQTQEE